MNNQVFSSALFLLCLVFLGTTLSVEAGRLGTCKPSGKLRGRKPPPGQCNTDNDSDCCVDDKLYPTYKYSPPVSGQTKATLTLNCFEENCDGGAPSECDGNWHSDDDPVVALSTGWYNQGSRCFKHINVYGNGRTVKAKVVDECDSTMGCDPDHDYQPPCPNNIVNLKLFGRPWRCRKVTGAKWTYIGQMPNSLSSSYVCSKCYALCLILLFIL